MNKKYLILFLIIGTFLIAGCKQRIGQVGSTHEHIDFKVYIDNKEIDFAKQEYMVKARYVHIESMDDDVIHKHATGVTMADFIKTLGMELTPTCFKMNNQEYCSNSDKTLKIYFNGQLNDEAANWELRDLDKYLISYGNDNEANIKKQLSSVTNKACIDSKKC